MSKTPAKWVAPKSNGKFQEEDDDDDSYPRCDSLSGSVVSLTSTLLEPDASASRTGWMRQCDTDRTVFKFSRVFRHGLTAPSQSRLELLKRRSSSDSVISLTPTLVDVEIPEDWKLSKNKESNIHPNLLRIRFYGPLAVDYSSSGPVVVDQAFIIGIYPIAAELLRRPDGKGTMHDAGNEEEYKVILHMLCESDIVYNIKPSVASIICDGKPPASVQPDTALQLLEHLMRKLCALNSIMYVSDMRPPNDQLPPSIQKLYQAARKLGSKQPLATQKYHSFLAFRISLALEEQGDTGLGHHHSMTDHAVDCGGKGKVEKLT
ncbi:hypothetical protein C8Q80DRAFT_941006 [Daedaleopsis nitida]|nr:hypothetical protein C8Q80DRAFT_941006 [Daedaleopsis nitida]